MMEIIFTRPSSAAANGSSSKIFPRFNLPPSVGRSLLALAIAACWMAGGVCASAVQSVTLAWDRSSDTSAIGYRIYAYEENATVPESFNVFGLTKVKLAGLKEGLRYTFKVTSYNAAGVESAPAGPAEVVVPVPLQLLPGPTPNDLKQLQFPVAPGHWYEIQSSTNMQTWTTVQQTGTATAYAWTQIQEPGPALRQGTQVHCRFFRLKIH